MIDAQMLLDGWIRHFGPADRAMDFVDVEREVAVPLQDGVILVGIIDAVGPDWFGEWKTMSPSQRRSWKARWRFHPQTLTYGLLAREAGILRGRRFTVRVAFKSDPPTYDHEWYTYTDEELNVWRDELRLWADAMGWLGGLNPPHYPLNPLSCMRYGSQHACPFIPHCSRGAWDTAPPHLVPRESHLRTERESNAGALILDATRIMDWLSCPERFRRHYVQNLVEPPGEALRVGSAFHQLLAEHYRTTKIKRESING